MPRKRIPNFNYSEVTINGHKYFKAYVMNADHKLIIVYGKTLDELCQKYDEAEQRSENDAFNRRSPTVKEYCEKWLLMQSAHIRETTLIDYTSKVKRHIIAPLGHMKIAEVTADDIKMALVPVSKKSASVFKSVNILYKCIFNSAEDSKIITYNPTRFLSAKGGGVPQKDRESKRPATLCVRNDRPVCRASTRGDPGIEMGMCLSGYRSAIYRSSQSMAYREQQTGDYDAVKDKSCPKRCCYSGSAR